MSDLLFDHDAAVADWVGKINGKTFEPPYTAIGIVAAGRLTGGFVFTGYNGHAVEMSLAGHGVIKRGAWRAVRDYVFRQLDCSRLQLHTRRGNARVRHMAPKLGFCFEGVARCFYGSDDGLCFSLIRDDLPQFEKRWKL